MPQTHLEETQLESVTVPADSQLGAGSLSPLEAERSNARIEDIPPAGQRKTHSALPVIADIPADAFAHLISTELPQTRNAPTLGEQLEAQETDIFIELAQNPGVDSQLGKISKPGLGAFAPLFIPEEFAEDTDRSASAPVVPTPLMKPVPEPSQPIATEPVIPTFTANIPADTAPATVPQPFVPRGKPLQNQGSKDVLNDLRNPSNAQVVADTLAQILYTEGPIGANRLAKLVADAFGMQRLHPKRRQKILELLDSEVLQDITEFGTFIWPAGTTARDFNVFRTGSIYGQRALVDICDEEFNNALIWVIDTQHPLEEETSEAVARVLDLTAARTDIRQRMQAGLKTLEQAGRLRRLNGHLSLQ